MTSAVVNDASCLIDLRKGGLLPVLRELPYALVVPLPVRESEVLDFSNRDWRLLDDAGMVTHDLTPALRASAPPRAFDFRHQVRFGIRVGDQRKPAIKLL